jgi:hypothetical protein
MKYVPLLSALLLLAIAIENLPAQSDLSINGYLQTYNRLRFDTNTFTWNENRLNLNFEGALSDKYHFFSEVRLRGLGVPDVTQTSDLQRQEKDKVYPWGLEFREAYLDLYQFGLENLDLRIGRQIISWGTADNLNPTSNVSPYDFEDIFTFGEKLGTNALLANYYLGESLTLTGIYIPIFTPSTLPYGDYAKAFAPPIDLPPGSVIRNISDTIVLPENTLSESSQFAFKAATTLFDYDVSLSYFKGRDTFPLINEAIITPVDMVGTVDIETSLMYPKIQVIGGDFAGSVGSVGFWGEGALFKPEKVEMTTVIDMGGLQVPQNASLSLDDETYFKWVLGGDYTFSNGIYINTQFLHGFIHERGRENLNDYIVFRLEKKVFNDALKIAPISGASVITDWGDLQNNYGLAYIPEITYYPSDNIEMILGAFLLDGKGHNFFSQIKDMDELYVKVKVSF